MAIWCPLPSVSENVKVLSDSHLADVVWQGLDTLRVLTRDDPGLSQWVRMWRSCPATLLYYVLNAEAELRARGIGEEPRVLNAFSWYHRKGIPLSPVPPWWLGSKMFHQAQCSHLIAVDPVHYARRLPLTTPLDLKMIWPLEDPNEWTHN